MHYKAFLITREFPTDKVISEVMQPFNEGEYYNNEKNEPYPVFMWDWYSLGGRYNSFFKLDIDNTEDKYRWDYIEDRNNKVFRSYLFDELKLRDERQSWRMSEYKFYPCLGIQDGYIRVDGGLIADMKDFDITECYIIVDANGNAYARSSWDGDKWAEDKQFDERAKSILKASKEYYICTIDIHD